MSVRTSILIIIVLLFIAVTNTAAAGNPVTLDTCHSSWHNHPIYTMTTGPDGNAYPTWHPQADTRHTQVCNYRHDHGTNSALLFPSGWRPPFGYAATVALGQPQFHEGHKGIGFFSGDFAWYFIMHQGSSGHGAICTRYHDFGVYVENYLTGERMAELYFMADFGRSERNTDNKPLTPVSCPDQGVTDISGEHGPRGRRLFGTIDSGGQTYSPWAMSGDNDNATGFDPHLLIMWADPIRMCDDINCENFELITSLGMGAKRLVQIDSSNQFGLHATTVGEFCTDPYAEEVINCQRPNAVHQYINPTLQNTVLQPELLGTKCYQRSANDGLYMCLPHREYDPSSNHPPYDPWGWSTMNAFEMLEEPN